MFYVCVHKEKDRNINMLAYALKIYARFLKDVSLNSLKSILMAYISHKWINMKNQSSGESGAIHLS